MSLKRKAAFTMGQSMSSACEQHAESMLCCVRALLLLCSCFALLFLCRAHALLQCESLESRAKHAVLRRCSTMNGACTIETERARSIFGKHQRKVGLIQGNQVELIRGIHTPSSGRCQHLTECSALLCSASFMPCGRPRRASGRKKAC